MAIIRNRVQFQDLMTEVLVGRVTVDPASLLDGAGATIAITISGAALGDFVMFAAPIDLQDITVTAYVQAANLVEIRVQNESGLTVDLASSLWKIIVLKTNQTYFN